MQSRYYNPEWGRYINADVIAAMTGKLLSSNMFAYCFNNITLKYPSGFRPIYTQGEETEAMREASLATMSKTNMYNYQKSKANIKLKGSPGVSYDYAGTAITTTATTVQNAPIINVKIPYWKTTIKSSMAELDIFGNMFTGISVASLFNSINSNNATYKSSEAAAMNMVDALTWAGGMYAGAALLSISAPVVVILGAGLAIGYGGYYIKK